MFTRITRVSYNSIRMLSTNNNSTNKVSSSISGNEKKANYRNALTAGALFFFVGNVYVIAMQKMKSTDDLEDIIEQELDEQITASTPKK